MAKMIFPLIKVCDKSLLKLLIIFSENSTESSCYPDIWKKSNIIPVHKENETTDQFLFYPFLEKYLKK